MSTPTAPIIAPPHVLTLLKRLHSLSQEQEDALDSAVYNDKLNFDRIMRDKFIALDEDKCCFTYQLLRAMGAKNVVEAGTSYGVSTVYLALAISHNLASNGGEGKVIATENEPEKAAQAVKHWQEAGEDVFNRIDLRLGDLRDTLRVDLPTIDLLLLDIWAPLALPTLKVVLPKLKPGAVVLTDNIDGAAKRYEDLTAFLYDSSNGFTNISVPYNKGFLMSVYNP